LAIAQKAISVVLVLGCFAFCVSCFGESASSTIDERVADLIGQMLNSATEHQAFSDLEALGCAAVPVIIERMDDRRPLPDHSISLRNNWPTAFEGLRHYSPQQVVDALVAVLNQLTGRDFGFIYNGATDAGRTDTVRAWREFLRDAPPSKLCDGG
jgi:hypothetical protein